MIAAGQKWKFLWQEAGNNGDGIVGTERRRPAARAERQQQGREARQERQDVGRLLGHAHRRRAVDEQEGRPVHRRARAARERRRSSRRSARCWPTSYQRRSARLHRRRDQRPHGRQQGRRVLHDGRRCSTPSPKGVVTKYGENITPNGIILSADEKTLYVTNGPTLRGVRRPARWLADQPARVREARRAAAATAARSTRQGRLYVTTNAGVQVIGAGRQVPGHAFPTPRGVITARVRRQGQEDAVHPRARRQGCGRHEVANAAQVWTIPMIAQGYKGRTK